MPISANQARAQFTNTLIDAFRQVPEVPDFLRSFFPSVQSYSKYISFDVERNGEQVSVDVLRGTEATRNTFSQNMNKTFLPPFYFEDFDATQLDLYDRAFGSPLIDEGVMSDLVQVMSIRIGQLRNKIGRAYEKQCAQVLTDGIVTLVSGDNIDFKRKAASILDAATDGTAYWDVPGADPYTQMETMADFIRETGREMFDTVNIVMGTKCWNAWRNNDVVQKMNTLRNWKFDDVVRVTGVPGGAKYHGSMDIGSYRANIFTYKQIYQDATTGTNTYYLDQTKVYMFPEKPRFKLAHAAVPQLLKVNGVSIPNDGRVPPLASEPYVIGDYTDDRVTAHVWNVKSAGVAIPIAVDTIVTKKCVA